MRGAECETADPSSFAGGELARDDNGEGEESFRVRDWRCGGSLGTAVGVTEEVGVENGVSAARDGGVASE